MTEKTVEAVIIDQLHACGLTGKQSSGAAKAILKALEEEGRVVVPKLPTEEMLKAGWELNDHNPLSGDLVEDTWDAMITAALQEDPQ